MDDRRPTTGHGTGLRRAAGVLLLVAGGVWMLDNVSDVDLPWNWILPGLLIVAGAALFARAERPVAPPSQFEREDAPRVP